MKRRLLCSMVLVLCVWGVLTLQAQGLSRPILGGELSNSAATSVEDIDEVMPRMRVLGLNTVLVPAYWELMEPMEGKFDFTLIDRTIDVARREQLQVVFLWFGAWKNSMSCYAPGWAGDDCRGEADGDCLVLQRQCAAGRSESIFGAYAAYQGA